MADYEVSPAYLDSLLRVIKSANRMDEILAAEPRLNDLAQNPFAASWHPAELLELLGEVCVRVLGEAFFEDMAYQAVKQRFGGIVLPLLGSAATKGNPAAVFSKLDAVVKVAIKGATLGFTPDGTNGGAMTVGYPRPVAAHTAISWRGVIRFVFEITGKTETGKIVAEDRAASGQALRYRLTW